MQFFISFTQKTNIGPKSQKITSIQMATIGKKKKEQVKEEPNNSHTARFDSNDHSEHDYTMLVMEVGSGNDTEG